MGKVGAGRTARIAASGMICRLAGRWDKIVILEFARRDNNDTL
jgi:hypothetical protein